MWQAAYREGQSKLPAEMPVFPLPGVLLLPGARLPLNIFEPRYLAMVDHVMATDRLIGMIQPLEQEHPSPTPALHLTGCAGRVIQYSETGDGHYLVTLMGISRFTISSELPEQGGYRRIAPDWSGHEVDLAPDECVIDRERMNSALREYFEVKQINADWKSIDASNDTQLVASLAMACPFAPLEKQALLEAPSIDVRAETMLALLEMAVHGQGRPDARH